MLTKLTLNKTNRQGKVTKTKNWVTDEENHRGLSFLLDTTAASFHDREEEGEVKQQEEEEKKRGKEVLRLSGKEEKDVAAPPTPSSASLPSFSSKTKNKAHGSCSGSLPTESICCTPVFLFLDKTTFSCGPPI